MYIPRFKRIAIIGSRNIRPTFSMISNNLPNRPEVVVFGGSKGVDTQARLYAEHYGIKLDEHFPDYKKYGRGAVLIRDRIVVKAADFVVCFWDGKSKGCMACVDYARDNKISASVVTV